MPKGLNTLTTGGNFY